MTATQTAKRPSDVMVGDVILFLGTPHLVVEIEPYTHPTLGPTHGIAKAADGWAMTLLGDAATVHVARTGA